MALVNHIKREINAKIVYYGPEFSGKATSLRYVYDRIKPELRGDLKTVPASGSSLLFFDFSPFEQPIFGGYRIRIHIYTLQGRVANPAAWKMTLKGTDGVVIVADGAAENRFAAEQSVEQLREFLGSYGIGLDDLPVVLQLNKADLAGTVDIEDIVKALGLPEGCANPTVAVRGEGVLKTLTSLSRLIMGRIAERGDLHPENGVPGKGSEDELRTVDDQTIKGSTHLPVPDTNPEAGRTVPSVAGPDAIACHEGAAWVTITESGVQIDGGLVRIPLSVSSSSGVQRLVVTVSVAAES